MPIGHARWRHARGVPAANLPPWLRFSDEVVWPNFRFGSKPGVPYPDSQFPFESCQALIGRVKAAGGDARMLNPPDQGIRGNSHMIMQDKNHLQIADLILQWIGQHASKRSPPAQ